MWIVGVFNHQDKQLVLQIIQSGDIKPLQKRVKEGYLIKTELVNSQTNRKQYEKK